MSRIRHCTNPSCPNYHHPKPGWFVHIGSYHTAAHGTVHRVRCRSCNRSLSTQTFSIHYYAKRRLPLHDVFLRLRGGSSLRDIARSFHVSTTAIRSAVYRLGRQAIAAHALLSAPWTTSNHIVFDGLQSSLTAKDFPCHITVAVDAGAELVLDMTHTVLRRGGVLTPKQRVRKDQKEAVWKPRQGSLIEDISRLVRELPRFHSMPLPSRPLIIDTDEHPVYRSVIVRDLAMTFWKRWGMSEHRRTSGKAPRTRENALFPVNYLDRLVRHRMKEHTRKTIAFGRHAVDQMHRSWIMVMDHNYIQPWRVKNGDGSESHGERAGIARERIEKTLVTFFRDRVDLRGVRLTESMRMVWEGVLEGPPVRWRCGQSEARRPRIPAFVLREVSSCTHFG